MLKITDISLKKLRNGELMDKLPEFYELKEVIENNSWHLNESTFEHTLTVLKELEKIIDEFSTNLSPLLNTKINGYSRSQLLFLAAVFHDIAKKETCVLNGKISTFPRHEDVGTEKTMKILERFDLSQKEKEIVTEVIKYHGVINPLLNPENTDIMTRLEEFKEKYQDVYVELVLIGMADTLGSQLKKIQPENFKFKMKIYRDLISNFK